MFDDDDDDQHTFSDFQCWDCVRKYLSYQLTCLATLRCAVKLHVVTSTHCSRCIGIRRWQKWQGSKTWSGKSPFAKWRHIRRHVWLWHAQWNGNISVSDFALTLFSVNVDVMFLHLSPHLCRTVGQ